MIKRQLEEKVLEAAQEFPVVAVMGPRQSGKTTLVQKAFPEHTYVSLEDFDVRALATEDPRTFLQEQRTSAGMIIDEIQHAPQLLSYMQTIVDAEKKNGTFVITGSQNFLVNEAITQTLAGRMAVMTLLPLSIQELVDAKIAPQKIEPMVFQGCFPRLHAQKTSPSRLYTSYIRTYVERDVRQLKAIEDLSLFQKFMGLCAGRIGQMVNLTSLGDDCGITAKTVRSWLSVLEASYVIFLLQPYHKNFGKRLVKMPKLYFVDTGVASTLLRIKSDEELTTHSMRGALVENVILADLLKQQHNMELLPNLYYWRDKTGHEIDCIIDTGRDPVAVEIKAGRTISPSFFDGLVKWQAVSNLPGDVPRYVVYGGKKDQKWPQAEVLGWPSAGSLLSKTCS